MSALSNSHAASTFPSTGRSSGQGSSGFFLVSPENVDLHFFQINTLRLYIHHNISCITYDFLEINDQEISIF